MYLCFSMWRGTYGTVGYVYIHADGQLDQTGNTKTSNKYESLPTILCQFPLDLHTTAVKKEGTARTIVVVARERGEVTSLGIVERLG